MKKLFIGCGIVVLLLLGGAGFLAWRFWGAVRDIQIQADAAIVRLNELSTTHPFDAAAQAHLDPERFARALDVRARIGDDVSRVREQLDEMQRKEDSGETDLGVLELMELTLRAFAPLVPGFADRLIAAEMSWPEFAWHSRVLWATLYRASLGFGSPALEPLRDAWPAFKETYERTAREAHGLPPIRDLVGEFPPVVLSDAEAVMLADLDRVRAGLRATEFEHLFMRPVTTADDLQYVTPPEEAAALPPAPEPAPEPAPAPR